MPRLDGAPCTCAPGVYYMSESPPQTENQRAPHAARGAGGDHCVHKADLLRNAIAIAR